MKSPASRCFYRSRPPNSVIKLDHDEHQETGRMVEESSSHRSGTSAPRRTRTRGRGEGERGRWEMTCRGCPSLSYHHCSSSKICVPWPSDFGTKFWPKEINWYRLEILFQFSHLNLSFWKSNQSCQLSFPPCCDVSAIMKILLHLESLIVAIHCSVLVFCPDASCSN